MVLKKPAVVSFSPIATLGNRGLQESHHFPRKPKNEDVGQTRFVSRLPSLAGPSAAPLRAGQSALRPHTSLVHRGLRPGLVPPRPPGQTSSLGSQLGSPWLSSSARASGGPWGPATRTVPGQPCASRQRGGSHLRPAVTPDCLQALPLLLLSLPAPPPPSSSVRPSACSHRASSHDRAALLCDVMPAPCGSSKAVPRAWARGHPLLGPSHALRDPPGRRYFLWPVPSPRARSRLGPVPRSAGRRQGEQGVSQSSRC